MKNRNIDLDAIITAASERIGLPVPTAGRAPLKESLCDAVAKIEYDLDEVVMKQDIEGFRLADGRAETVECDRVTLAKMIRFEEARRWIDGHDSLIVGILQLFFLTRRAKLAVSDQNLTATLFVLVGYAIRRQAVRKAA